MLVREETSALRQQRLILIDGGHLNAAQQIALLYLEKNFLVEYEIALEHLDNGALGDVVIGRPEAAGGDDDLAPLERQTERLFHSFHRVADRSLEFDGQPDIGQTGGDK